MREEWRDVVGYEGRYRVSSLGRIMGLPCCSRSKARILKPNKKKSGYLNILLCKNGKVKTFRIHRLVAQAFLPNPENKATVNHKNGDKRDNRALNLEWATMSENTLHAHRELGIKSQGGVTPIPVTCIETGQVYKSIHEAERMTGVARVSIKNSCCKNTATKGTHWAFVTAVT